MTRWGSGTVPPDEDLDRLIRVSLQEEFSGYAPDPSSALGELRRRTHASKRKRRRILPFPPGISKTVIAVVCIVLVTAMALVLTEVPHFHRTGTMQQGLQQASVKIVPLPRELSNVSVRVGPAFELRGPHGQKVTGVLSLQNVAGSKPTTSGCDKAGRPALVHWLVLLTFSGDVSIATDPEFSATDRESGSPFLRDAIHTSLSATRTQMVSVATLSWAGQSKSADTVVPVDVDITYTGPHGRLLQTHLTPDRGWQFTADTRRLSCFP